VEQLIQAYVVTFYTDKSQSRMLRFFVAAPSPIIACTRKEALTQVYLRAVSEYHRMQSAKLAALRHGESFLFEDELAAAASERKRAKAAALAHSKEHGC